MYACYSLNSSISAFVILHERLNGFLKFGLFGFIWCHHSQATIHVRLEIGNSHTTMQVFLNNPIRYFLLVLLLQPMGLFVYLPCVNTAALNVAFHKSYCYSVWAYLYFILGPTALNVKVICVNVYYLAKLRW